MKLMLVPQPKGVHFLARPAAYRQHIRVYSSGQGANNGPDQQPHSGDFNMRDMSPEARQAQENILALNSSRVRALQELKVANEKIAELERMLEDAATQITNLRGTREILGQGGAPSSSSSPPSSVPGPASAQKSRMTIAYNTGWDQVYIHYQIDDQAWTQLPGVPMEEGKGSLAGKKVFNVLGNRLTFVLTNGAGKFDTPNPYGEPGRPKNYVLETPGTWELLNGELLSIKDE